MRTQYYCPYCMQLIDREVVAGQHDEDCTWWKAYLSIEEQGVLKKKETA